MKQLLSLIAGVVIIVGLMVTGFTLRQIHQERSSAMDDLQRRTSLLSDSLKESVRPYYLDNATNTLQTVLDKFANRERLLGLAVYDNKGNIFASSAGLPQGLVDSRNIPEQAMDADATQDGFSKVRDSTIYVYASPLRQDDKVVGALTVYQKADYIDASVRRIWQTSLIRLFVQALLFSLAIVLLLRLIIFKPLFRLVESARRIRTGQAGHKHALLTGWGFFKPLANEITKMSNSLLQARSAASEEARMRLQKLDSPWTAERLQEFIKAYLKDRSIYVVSNREPYSHNKIKNEITYSMPASGVVTALEAVMEACGGMWMAHGSGDADKETVDENDKVSVPPEEPKYTLKRVWLSEKEQQGYYVGFSNEALWPLCHNAHNRPIFRKEDWQEYRRVNGKFAQSLLTEIKNVQRPIILVQDYHFALLPKIIKDSRPDAQIGLFWHIPWPSAESFSICPWRREIVEGMLGADVVGFHTQQYCNNFLDTARKEIESLVDLEQFSITHDGHTAYIKPFPISVALTSTEKELGANNQLNLLEQIGIKTKYIGLGVDRMDYTKGILERFKGLEFFFETYPVYKEQFTFLQIAPPSRESVEKYREFSLEVTREAERINGKFQHNGWQPIVLLKKHHTHEELYSLYRSAHMCLVTPLHDGMNLVAKEFVAARNDEAGVLVLSQFTGAAKALKEALIINPYSAEQTAEAIHSALTMSSTEQYRRMKKMRDVVKNYNVYRWSAEFIKAVAGLG